MKQRCFNPKEKDFPHYGGRGITVCERWRNSFEAFLADMSESPGKGYSIERIDTNGNYEPTNCRWATQREQINNRRMTKRLTFQGETMAVADWARRIGCPRHLLHGRIKLGWSVEEILSRPARRRRKIA
jgi:hypothetical protein